MREAARVLLGVYSLSCASAHAEDVGQRAQALNQKALVFDAHCDTALRILDDGLELGVRSSEGHLDLPRMTEGGLKAQVFALWVEPEYWPDHAIHRALQLADAVLAAIEKHSDRLQLALSASDARRIVRETRVAIFLGIEGGQAIEDDLAALRMFHRLGVRVMTLTWMKNTNWADAAGDKPVHRGLTKLGAQVVQEMNRLGMVVDLSHASDQTFFQALKETTRPVIVSHSNCRSICNHYRNLSDDMLRALGKNGGVVGINFYPGFIDPEASQKLERLWEEFGPRLEQLKKKHAGNRQGYLEERRKLLQEHLQDIPRVPIDRLVDHLDHAVKVAGIDHVGLGSDFDGISVTPVGLHDASRLPLLTEKLLQRGYSEEDLAKLLGGNLLRVFEQAIGK